MKKLIILLFFINFYANSQTINGYYIEFKSINDIPEVYTDNNNIILVFENETLNELINGRTINKFELAFPEGKDLLERVYYIECSQDLITDIASFTDIINNYEYVEPIHELLTPNDFGNNDPNFNQSELTFINAQSAWDITSGSSNVLVGNTEGVYVNQEDLLGKVQNIAPSSTIHGTQVAVVAAGNTDNEVGISSIGFNSGIITRAGQYSSLIPLANRGARVINMSWGGCTPNRLGSIYWQEVINQVSEMGVVLIAAAGNGWASCGNHGPTAYYFPASFDNVIAVTSIGHIHNSNSTGQGQGNREDIFENYNLTSTDITNLPNGVLFTMQYNDFVDINAPGYDIVIPKQNSAGIIPNEYQKGHGTSFAAPMTAGLVGLMFDVNPCLFPNEVESILKLSSIKNDTLSLNLPYENKIGSGRLNAFESVKMSKDMYEEFGTVEIFNKILKRWKYVLKSNPYKISLDNVLAIDNATLDFEARHFIDITNSDIYPISSAYSDLKITSNYYCNESVIAGRINNMEIENVKNLDKIKMSIIPNPNNGIFDIYLNTIVKSGNLEIYDINGRLVFTKKFEDNNSLNLNVDVSNLKSGVYIAKIINSKFTESIKFIKK